MNDSTATATATEEALIDPSLLKDLSPEEREEALAAAAAARRAEERAEQREMEALMKRKQQERLQQRQQQQQQQQQRHYHDDGYHPNMDKMTSKTTTTTTASSLQDSHNNSNNNKLVFLSKRQRAKLAEQRKQQQQRHEEEEERNKNSYQQQQQQQHQKHSKQQHHHHHHQLQQLQNAASSAAATTTTKRPITTTTTTTTTTNTLSQAQRLELKRTYLGKSAVETEDVVLQQQRKKRAKQKITFKFEWDNTDDTLLLGGGGGGAIGEFTNENNGGVGGGGGDDLYAAAAAFAKKKQAEKLQKEAAKIRRNQNNTNNKSKNKQQHHHDNNSNGGGLTMVESLLQEKPLDQMTPRDWRIVLENYDIRVRGGKAPPPLRRWEEANLPSCLMHAIQHTLKYKEPSPIQRQSIPIGLQRRDLIGIAETGSGKTAAFGIPLMSFLIKLCCNSTDNTNNNNIKDNMIVNVKEQGPLAMVLAPTRELALQINVEFERLLSSQTVVQTCAVVGGQPILQQAQRLREGVHIVVGTPGRIHDCVEMAYLVLNQCCYVVLDEADRMVDLGFKPQIEAILDAMGVSIKSSNEAEAYQQEAHDLSLLSQQKPKNSTSSSSSDDDDLLLIPKHRVTAMFSATMPPEVERLAKTYTRHPAVVTIGDQDSGKNKRIEQRIVWLASSSQKERALRQLLFSPQAQQRGEKIIVFVNEKKTADVVGRMVDRMGQQHSGSGVDMRAVVLHGGKVQAEREENLDAFKHQNYYYSGGNGNGNGNNNNNNAYSNNNNNTGRVILVATDVAGRGLDIANVTHVINYDLPSRSIDNYSHRIGRTGRAGKEGRATSFLTPDDETIMGPLKAYLESTGMPVPHQLAHHPAAGGSGSGGSGGGGGKGGSMQHIQL